MTFAYLASFDLLDRRHGLGIVTFERSGSDPFEVDLRASEAEPVATADGLSTTLVLNHYSASDWDDLVGVDADESTGVLHTVAGLSFAAQVTEWMRAAATGVSWPSPSNLSCAFNSTTLRYTFAYSGDAIAAISFSNDATAELFGMSAGGTYSGASITAPDLPAFCLQPELAGVSTPNTGDGIDYEMPDITASTAAVSGQVFGIVRSSVPLFRDWTQQSEPRNKALRFDASADSLLFSHQALFEQCSCVHPFVVMDGFGDGLSYLFRLRADSCMWSSSAVRRAASNMDDAHVDVRYQAQTLGVFT